MKTSVSEKGQVTIPKALRDRLGIRPGQTLEFYEEGGRLIAARVAEADPVDRVYGILTAHRTTDALLRALRGKPDAVGRK